MEIRVFVKDIAKNCRKQDFIDAIKKRTRGSRRIRFLSSPEYSCSYALVPYGSLEDAIAAIETSIVLKGQRAILQLYDDPREMQEKAVAGAAHVLDTRILIGSEWLKKEDLAYSIGLQLALSNQRSPRWCRYTEASIDCPRGERCDFIHLRKHQVTTSPIKKGLLSSLKPIEFEGRIIDNAGNMLFESAEFTLSEILSLRSAVEADRISQEIVEESSRAVYEKLMGKDLTNTFPRAKFEHPTSIILENDEATKKLSVEMDRAVERLLSHHTRSDEDLEYVTVRSQTDINNRMNASLSALLDGAKDRIMAFSFADALNNLAKIESQSGKSHTAERRMIVQSGKNALGIEFYACFSYTHADNVFQSKVEVFYPAHDFLFSPKMLAHINKIHEALQSYVDVNIQTIADALQKYLKDDVGMFTLCLGVDDASQVSLLGAYTGGITIDEALMKKLSETRWKRVYRTSPEWAPIIAINTCPPVSAIQGSAPQAWLNLQKRYCEFR